MRSRPHKKYKKRKQKPKYIYVPWFLPPPGVPNKNGDVYGESLVKQFAKTQFKFTLIEDTLFENRGAYSIGAKDEDQGRQDDQGHRPDEGS